MENESSALGIWFMVCEVVNGFLIGISLWILICMITFGVKTKKWRTNSDGTNLDGGKVYIACVVAVAWSIPKYAMTQLLFHPYSLPQCEWIMDSMVVAFYFVLWQVYFFLWLRHRAIYAHPTVKRLMGKYSNPVSWFMLIALTLISIGVLCGFTVPKAYVLGQYGCVLMPKSNRTGNLPLWDVSSNYILGGFLIIAQISFLSLFIYPMIATKQMRKTQKNNDAENRSTDGEISENRPKRPTLRRKRLTSLSARSNDNISKTIVRSVVASALAVCSDLAAALVVALAMEENIPRAITVTVYDISLMISIFCIMATFGSPERIMFVFCRPRRRLVSASSEKSLPRSRTTSTELWD